MKVIGTLEKLGKKYIGSNDMHTLSMCTVLQCVTFFADSMVSAKVNVSTWVIDNDPSQGKSDFCDYWQGSMVLTVSTYFAIAPGKISLIQVWSVHVHAIASVYTCVLVTHSQVTSTCSILMSIVQVRVKLPVRCTVISILPSPTRDLSLSLITY